MKFILQNLKTIADSNTYNNELFAELMTLFSELSPEDIAAILPYIVAILSSSFMATAAVAVICVEIHRRGRIVDGTISVDGQSLNRELARGIDTFNDTVSTATDFVDRTTTLIEGQGGNIAPGDLSRVNEIAYTIDGIRTNLEEISDLTDEVSNSHLDDFDTILSDFLEAFDAFMNIYNGF